MKKLIVVLAILSLTGIAFGAGIPMAVEPGNYPEVWTMEVYNNNAAAITSGSVVVWDIRNSTTPAAYTNRLMYVDTTTTLDDPWTAGVVIDGSIAAANVGTIAIFGPVYVRCQDATDAVTVSGLVGTSATAGQVGGYGGQNGYAPTAALGIALSSGPNTVANGGFGGTAGNNDLMIPILIEPTLAGLN